jgi:hypothetical protein
MSLKVILNSWCAVAVAIVTVSGCSGVKTPPVGQVGGIVTLDGQPLTKGQVQFLPDSSKGTKGRMAVGLIGTDGRFALTAFKPGDGALVGFHKVVIICEEDMPAFDPKSPPPPPKSLIPIRYTDAKTSGLTAEVKAAAKNDFTFALESRPPSQK